MVLIALHHLMHEVTFMGMPVTVVEARSKFLMASSTSLLAMCCPACETCTSLDRLDDSCKNNAQFEGGGYTFIIKYQLIVIQSNITAVFP